MSNSIKIIKLKQPAALKLAVFTALCERFGFYILSFMLVLYAKDVFGFSDAAAFSLFAVVTALGYMLPAIGGYVGDNIFGIRRCIILGLIIEASGLCLLAIPSPALFPISLAMVVIGVGLFKIGPTNLLGRAYEENDPRIDAGFTLYYMGFNIGGLASAILSGVIARYWGWHAAFLVGGLGVFTGLLCYFLTRKSVTNLDSPIGQAKLPSKVWFGMFLAIVLLSIFCSFLLSHVMINNILFALVGFSLAGYYIYEMVKSTHEDRLKIMACLMLIFIGMVYFSLYFQLFTSVTLFIDRVVNRHFFWFVIPTETYMGLNSVWVIILGPILAWAYKSIAARYGKDLAITVKFGLGLLAVSASFFTLVLGIWFANANAQVASFWIILCIFLYTLGEMLVSALGVAMVAHLVPKRMYGVTMGAWFFGCSLAALASGWFASLASVPASLTDLHAVLAIYSAAFTKISLGGLVITALVFLVGPTIKRMGNLE